jgi:hypothetical protein
MIFNPDSSKKWSNYKVLVQIAMRLHNPQVIQAYRHYLDSPEDAIHVILLKHLKIYKENSILEVLLKFGIFYFVDGRLWVQSSTPMWWPQKAESFKPQLTIQYRPLKYTRKTGPYSYHGNPELHIPHYDGSVNPSIPRYTIGRFSAKYTLRDQTYLMINAATQDEAIAVITKMASYTRKSKRPDGEISANISTNTRPKVPRMNGVTIEPFKAEYFSGGKEGTKSILRLQL